MGLLSSLGFGGGDDGGAAKTLKEGIKEWKRLKIPTQEDLAYQIEQYGLDAQLRDPTQLFTGDLAQGDTALGDIAVDPNALAQQQDALSRIGEVATEGITATEQADIQNLMTQEAIRQKGAREAIMDNYAERGIAGGGGELASQLLNNQASADRGSQRAFDIAALGKNRALDALGQQGDLSSRVRGQDYGEQANAAKAQDAIDRFNINQDVNTRQQNFNRNYDAGLNRQKVDMANADRTTQQNAQFADNLKYRTGVQIDKTAGIAGQYGKLAQSQAQTAKNQQDLLRNTLGTAATVAGTMFAGPAGGVAANAALSGGGGMDIGFSPDSRDFLRADGGPVGGGEAYIVGEEGPELIAPMDEGMVIPADDTEKILESVTGMSYKDDEDNTMKKMMCNNMEDIQSRLRNLEQSRGVM